MTLGDAVTGEIRDVLVRTAAELGSSPYAGRIGALADRIDGPLRVAVAGRVKAGKSTLLNALVGERLAPTDTGECTKIVSWYERAAGYQVEAELLDGSSAPLPFDREGGALRIDLGGLTEREVARIKVGWPASRLASLTLIDTPGLASVNDENSRRTREFLEADADNASEADAVVYLMRHLHRTDVRFLDAFMDRSVGAASPVNTVAVLSRADEVGAGRLDAMESSRRIAARYQSDPTVRGLASAVVPVAGLLAETALTLREEEVAALRRLVGADMLDRALLSAEGFVDPGFSDLAVEPRRDLLDRLGMFGLRIALREMVGGARTAADLAPVLVEHSGLSGLQRVIDEQFLPRARLLKARSALASVRVLLPELRVQHPAESDRLAREVERIDASAIDFARLRAAHLLAAMDLRVPEQDRANLQRLLLASSDGDAMGLPAGAPVDEVRQAALEAVGHWRARAADPLAAPTAVEVFETAARAGESIYAAAGRGT